MIQLQKRVIHQKSMTLGRMSSSILNRKRNSETKFPSLQLSQCSKSIEETSDPTYVESINKIAQAEIEIIAKRARKVTDELLSRFAEMHSEIERKPDDIESLTAIKEYMEKCAAGIDKIQAEIKE